ncbi:MAG: helix-turn-helix domain-containing protein [Thermomicrobiales bacterium]
MTIAPMPAVTDLSPVKLRRELHLSRERMARLLDVSAKTVERWETRDAPPASRATRERLAQIAELTSLGKLVYSPAGFDLFLATPMPVFGGKTALQLIEIGEIARVMSAIVQDYEGLGS